MRAGAEDVIVLVTGGASSGKSAFAEALALSLPGPHWYVASMRAEGAEAQARIERHRHQRAGKGFRTMELQHILCPWHSGPKAMDLRETACERLSEKASPCHPERSGESPRAANLTGSRPMRPPASLGMTKKGFFGQSREGVSRIAQVGENAAQEGSGQFSELHPAGTVLLEDLGNLVANGWEGHIEGLLACGNTVIVGNEVGCDGVRYGGFTDDYIQRLGALSCQLAARADAVVEVVAGIPLFAKGDKRQVAPWLS